MSSKIDFKKKLKSLYSPPSDHCVVLKIPLMNYIMIDGIGSPGECQEYFDCIAAIYPVAFKIKFLSKAIGKDYIVPPLEGLWWADDLNDFIENNRQKWKWTIMIMQPEWINEDIFNKAIESVKQNKPEIAKTVRKLRFETIDEGKVAQIMHIGPYSEEGSTIEKLHNFIQNQSGKFDGLKKKNIMKFTLVI